MVVRLRIAVAGAGSFGREHLRVLAAMDDVAIAGVADPNRAAAEGAAATFGAGAWTEDVADLLDRTRPDGIVIASPGHTHVALASMALARGIPILLEKPVGLTASDADLLIAAEGESRAFILPGHILRFSAPYRTVADVARSGEIGAVLSVNARNHRDDSHAVRYPDIDPVLMTMIHDIDLAVWISGAELMSVLAFRRPSGTFRSETIATAGDTRGSVWHMSSAWTYPTIKAPPDRLEVIGERGSVELTLGENIRVFGDRPREIDLRTAPADNELRNELSYFADCIRLERRPEVVTLRDARVGLAAAEAIIESALTGEFVRR